MADYVTSTNRWNIQNTGYTGNSITYETVGKRLTNTNTNGNSGYYTAPKRTSSNTATITYDTAHTSYETSTTTIEIMYPYVSTSEVYTSDVENITSTYQTYSIKTETFDVKVLDVEIETYINKEEYVSLTYQRKIGNEWKQGNNSYTDYYSYMITSDFGGVSASILEQSSTNWTSVSNYTYSYGQWDYSWTYSWTWTTTTSQSWDSSWHSMTAQHLVSFDDFGNAVYETVDNGWWDNYIVDYTVDNYYAYVYGSWWGVWTYYTNATRPHYLQGGGDLLHTAYLTVTTNINTYSKSYINKSSYSNRPIRITLSAIQTLSKEDYIKPTNNTFSITTFYNLGTRTIPVTSKTTTWELI